MAKKETKTARIGIRVTEKRKAKLASYCDFFGISIAELIGRFIDSLPDVEKIKNRRTNNEDSQD